MGHVAPQGGARSGAASARGHGRFRLAALLSLLFFAAEATAKPSIAVIPFGRFPVERQLTHALCAEVTCVNAGQVTRQGRVDWERVSAAQLTGVVLGKIVRDASTHKRLVDIQVVAPGHIILFRKKAPLQSMALSAANLHALTVELVGVLNRAHGPERAAPAQAPAAPAAETAAAAAGPREVLATVPPKAATAPAASAQAAPTQVATLSSEEAVSGAEAAQSEEREPALLEVQSTFAVLNRQYSYSSATSTNPILRNSTSPGFLEPGLQVGFFPVRASSGAFESFGLQAGAAIAVGLTLQRENDTSGLLFPADSITANVALVTRLRVGRVLRLAPLLGWQMMNFDVHPASGVVLTGQPGVHWRALSAGLKLDVDFTSWCTLFVEASYLYVYTAGPLTSAAFFTNSSSAPSFDSALGLAFRVSPRLEVRLGFVFTLYALSFGGSGPAPVRRVSDQLLGGTLGIRYNY